MEVLVAAAMPLVLLWILFIMLARMLPGHASDVFIGHVARDVFWGVIRLIGWAIMLPVILLSFLLRELSGAPPPRQRRGHGRRRRRR